MIRIWISNFIRNNKDKIKDFGSKLLILAFVVIIATMIFLITAGTDTNNKDNEDTKNVYKPMNPIKGEEVTNEQYEKDTSLVNTFLDYCNNKKIEEAYDLLSDGCKENLYHTLNIFKTIYYDPIFSEKRTYNLQSWISTDKYTIYKIRYTQDMLSTGIYKEGNVFQDYITLIKGEDSNKISVGTYIESEKIEKKTITDELEILVLERDILLENEVYKIQVKNKTDKTIMLDTLENGNTIRLIGLINGAYKPYITKMFKRDLIIAPGGSTIIDINFSKPCSSNYKSNYIKLYRVIRDYDEYINNPSEYKDTFSVEIDL